MKKRILSIILAVVMIAGMIPLGSISAAALTINDAAFAYYYVPLPYISNGEGQYINTGYKAGANVTVSMDLMITSWNKWYNGIFGSRTSSHADNSFVVCRNNTNNSLRSEMGNKQYTYPAIGTNNRSILSLSGTSNFKGEGLDLYLFGLNEGGKLETTYGYATYNLYSCQIKDNDTVVRDLTPAKRKSDGVAGLYDLIEGKFYTSETETNFNASYSITDGTKEQANGSISIEKTAARTGETVTVNVTPNDGYMLKKLTFTGSETKTATNITKDSNSKYSFEMPDENITVTAEFAIPVTVPTFEAKHFFDGFEQIVVEAGTGYTVSGDFKATNIGVYLAVAALEENYIWSDGTAEPKFISWAIYPVDVHEHIFGESGKCSVCGEVPYIDRTWNGTEIVETPKSVYAIPFTENTTEIGNDNWYIVDSNVEIDDRIAVIGTANIILRDGFKLTANNGITVEGTNTLNIYGQSKDTGELSAGELLLDNPGNSKYRAGIGGGLWVTAGNINIYGGIVTAKGGDSAAAIGGGYAGNISNITINGGKVEAIARYYSAGIGSGYGANGSGGTITGTITINDGVVKATGNSGSAGIGGSVEALSPNIVINGGTVEAVGGGVCQAIGNGLRSSSSDYSLTAVELDIVKAGADKATATDSSIEAYVAAPTKYLYLHNHEASLYLCTDNGDGTHNGACICEEGTVNEPHIYVNGVCKKCGAVPNAPYIDRTWNGTEIVETQKALDAIPFTENTTEIGNGNWYVVDSDVVIDSGIFVTGTANIILNDGFKLTTNEGITVEGENTLNIYGQSDDTGTLIANGEDGHAGIGGGEYGSAGNINIYGGTVTATGGDNGAGIGGGYECDCGNITINGGIVTAIGGELAAGIGNGTSSGGGKVTINGGVVKATGNGCGAGLGGSYEAFAPEIEINGGTVELTGGERCAAMGHGAWLGYHFTYDLNFKIAEFDIIKSGLFKRTATDSSIEAYIAAPTEYLYIHKHKQSPYSCTDNGDCTHSGVCICEKGTVNEPHTFVNGVCEKCGAIAGTSYIDRTWNGTEIVESTKAVYAIPFTENTTEIGNGKWYVVDSNVVIDGGIFVTGTANIIIKDGFKLTVNKSIIVEDENTLNIYGQSEDTGELIITSERFCAGIGGRNGTAGGYININGGTIKINADGNGAAGAGIGGGDNADGGIITINGGNITAIGGDGGAGIGGSMDGDGGIITINGGDITAKGTTGIGGGYQGDCDITINGGNIKATGYDYSAGIGTGTANGGNITINGGKIEAIGGSEAAGIGAGSGNNELGISMNIIINDGEVTATGGYGATGIGGGYSNFDGYLYVTINGGKIEAIGGSEGAGIGFGQDGHFLVDGMVTINGGTVKATGGYGSAGIGGSCRTPAPEIILNGGTVEAVGGEGCTALGNGQDCYDGNSYSLTAGEFDIVKAGADKETATDSSIEAYVAAPTKYLYIHNHIFIGDECACGARLTPIDTPAMKFIYFTGEECTLSAGEGYTLSGDFKATDVGTYYAVATLDEYYIWSDGTKEPKYILWLIIPSVHEHTFATEYSYNETVHWQVATCEHSALTNILGEHTFDENGICTVCGYEKKTDALTETKTEMKAQIDTAVENESDEIKGYAETAKGEIDECESLTALVGKFAEVLNEISAMKTAEAIAAATKELEELDVISSKAKAIVKSVKPLLAKASSPAEVEEVMKQAKSGIDAAEEKVTDTDRHIVNKLPVETDNLMGHQYKTVNGQVINDVGRAIICLTEEQLNKITSDKVVIVGGDFEKETTITLDCAYTYFFAGETKYTAEDIGCAAFLIIDHDATGGAISGFGYYRVYDGSADSEDNFILDALYVNPNN